MEVFSDHGESSFSLVGLFRMIQEIDDLSPDSAGRWP